jgi:hypothetical protein
MSTVVKRRIRWRIRCPFREFTLELFLNARVSDHTFYTLHGVAVGESFCSEIFLLVELTDMRVSVSVDIAIRANYTFTGSSSWLYVQVIGVRPPVSDCRWLLMYTKKNQKQ